MEDPEPSEQTTRETAEAGERSGELSEDQLDQAAGGYGPRSVGGPIGPNESPGPQGPQAP